MGRGKGGKSTGSRSTNFSVEYDFQVFTLQSNDKPLNTTTIGKITTFKKAIENFNGTFEDLPAGGKEFQINLDNKPDDPDDDSPTDIVIKKPGLTLDLQARFVKKNDPFTRFDGELVIPSDGAEGVEGGFPLNDELDGEDNNELNPRIEYKIGNTFSNDKGDITELVLLIEGETSTDVSGNTKLVVNNSISIDVEKATTDINYIVEKNLLGSINGIRVSGQKFDDKDTIVSTEAKLTNSKFVPSEEDNSVSNKVIFGTKQDDIIKGFDGEDILFGRGGNDKLYGGVGKDKLWGNNGDDLLEGGAGDDRLWGNKGDDLLRGGKGNDILRGNAGNDTFVLAAEEGSDTVKDFQLGVDKIGLADGLTFANLTFADKNIVFGTQTLATLNISVASLTASDFQEIYF
ncbi:hypothetical protein [Myxosarcina sp. GI1]|uniref:calcium-binding protein n=1 Tax=Myxosarcina sp. GI1 TaxID=1541065 RepID=UPI000689E284|nr:hypothetical protein [Myxosarcina sp. GI1]